MNYRTAVKVATDTITDSDQMAIGDLAIIDEVPYQGQIVLRTFTGLVNLNDPHYTWTRSSSSLRVRLIPRGTEITLTVG